MTRVCAGDCHSPTFAPCARCVDVDRQERGELRDDEVVTDVVFDAPAVLIHTRPTASPATRARPLEHRP